MLPVEVWTDRERTEIPALQGEAYSYDYLIYCACYRITACLEKWLGVPLDYDGQHIPALIMLNPFQGPIWMHPEQGHEVGAIREAVKITRRAKQSLKEAAALETSGNLVEAQSELVRALRQVNDLPPPISIWMKNSSVKSIEEYQKLIGHIHVIFSEYLKERNGLRGHQRARTIAIVLRAIFEVHSDIPVKVGVTEGIPEGVYTKCLQEAFARAGVPMNFFRYAREAYALSEDDNQLAKFRDVLRNPTNYGDRQEI